MSRVGRLKRLGARILLLAIGALAAIVLLAMFAPAQAQSRVFIPEDSALYRHRVEQVAADVWGVDASPARLAAQLHQESAWRPRAQSPGVGAQGLAQFMPGTARWIAKQFPEQLGQFDPWDPMQAVLGAAIYDKWLLDRIQPIGFTRLSECSRWAFALRGYNGGEQWLLRDRGLAIANRGDPNDWRSVEKFRTRSEANHQQNIDYPRRILLVLEPAYIAAGWPGKAVC